VRDPGLGALIVNTRVTVKVRWVGRVTSVTVIDAVNVPVTVGVPVIAPVDALIFRPVGRPLADQLYGVVPPVAATVVEYGVFWMPLGNVAVVIFSGATIVSEKLTVAVRCVGSVESVAVIATVFTATTVGVPVIAPVDAFMLKPAGRPGAVNVIGPVPPVAATVVL
jgi:hypothetical protein